MTTFFLAEYSFGIPKAFDDICVVQWFKVNELSHIIIRKAHHALRNSLIKHIGEKK